MPSGDRSSNSKFFTVSASGAVFSWMVCLVLFSAFLAVVNAAFTVPDVTPNALPATKPEYAESAIRMTARSAS